MMSQKGLQRAKVIENAAAVGWGHLSWRRFAPEVYSPGPIVSRPIVSRVIVSRMKILVGGDFLLGWFGWGFRVAAYHAVGG